MSQSERHHIRLAIEADIPALEELIVLSVHGLQADSYSLEQRTVALGPVFGVDAHLIRDGTYFVVEHDGAIVGCGGWSRRRAVFGGDRDRVGEDEFIDPNTEPARIRAFFVHPGWARRGIATALLVACENAITQAGFKNATMVATLTGEPFYQRFGYIVEERHDVPLNGAAPLAVVRMSKSFQS